MGNLHHRRLHAKLDHYDCVFSHKQERPIEDVETEAQLGADSEGSRRFYGFPDGHIVVVDASGGIVRSPTMDGIGWPSFYDSEW